MTRAQCLKTLRELKREGQLLYIAGDMLGLREVMDHIEKIAAYARTQSTGGGLPPSSRKTEL